MPSTPTPNEPGSALPPVGARIIAFAAIIIAGVAGGFIGYAFVDLQTTGDSSLATGLGALIGAITAAIGTAVVVVLTLRAMGEWRTIKQQDPTAEDRRFPKGGSAGAARTARRPQTRVR
ncbi:MAG: hypothetical protein EBX39_10235 [Actinobacteria bacterium]|nr:hypothetical protein [Actinomycetota bacterium]